MVQSVSLPEALGAAEVPWVLLAAAPRDLPASPAGKTYSLHLMLKISSEKGLLCSLVYSWSVTLFACRACTSGRGSLLSSWRRGPA